MPPVSPVLNTPFSNHSMARAMIDPQEMESTPYRLHISLSFMTEAIS